MWDPYPQYTAGSSWVKLLSTCGAKAGVEVQRTAYDTTALTSKALLAAQQGNVAGHPARGQPRGLHARQRRDAHHHRAERPVDTGGDRAEHPRRRVINGKTYGVPIGANTLALYYNKTILKAAGVNPGLHHELGHR